MDLRQLKYFVRIVEVGSFTKAADALRIAQPALGFQIRKLEDELETQLLHRHSRGVEATLAGHLLFKHATALLQAAEAAKQELRSLDGQPRGTVNFGIAPWHDLSVQLITRVLQELPDVSLNVIEDYADNVIDHIRDERLDMGCIYRQGVDMVAPRGLVFEPLQLDRLYAIGSRQLLGDQSAPITFAELAAQPLILPREVRGIRERLSHVAESLGVQLSVAFQVESEPLVSRLVEEGVAVAVRPSRNLGQFASAASPVTRREIIRPELVSQFYLVYLEHKPLGVAGNALRRLILSIVPTDVAPE